MKAAVKKVRQPAGFFSIEPLPTADELRAFYAEQYYQQSSSASYLADYSADELAHKRLLVRTMLAALDVAKARNAGLLDVGCGEGFLLAEARTLGWPVTGIDFSSYAIEKFNPDLRDNVITGDALEIIGRLASRPAKYDACVLQNVLEHVIDPRAVLTSLRALLAPGGRLLVTLPNDFSPTQDVLMEKGLVDSEYWVVPPQHLHYFNIDTATRFAGDCGYRVVDKFSEFPIEFFLFHPGSNYVRSRDRGPAAHAARVAINRICAEKGLDAFLTLSRAYAGCGIGRAFTLVLARDDERP